MDSGDEASGRSPLAVAAVCLVVALLVAGLAWGAWWWRHPTVFDEAGGWDVGSGEKLSAGKLPIHITMDLTAGKSSGSVTLVDAEPHFRTNTAEAAVSFHVCQVKPPNDFFIGVPGALSSWCSEVTEIDGARFPLSVSARPRTQLVMTIESAESGELRLEGIDLTYRDGLQTGTQRVGPDAWFRIE